MVLFEQDAAQGLYRIVLTPNQSICWPQLVKVYLFICFISLSIAVAFASLGYWVVLPFSGLELVALGVALYVTNRMVFCKEIISSVNGVVKVEKGFNRPDESWQFDQHWVQINLETRTNLHEKTLISIGSHGKFVELGSFLDESEKEFLVFGLNEGILFPFFRADKYNY